MPPRHLTPRHKSPRSLSRSFGRLVADAVGTLPTAGVTSAVALVGAAGVVAVVGMASLDADANPTETAATVSGSGSHETFAVERDTNDVQVSRSADRPAHPAVQRATKNDALPISHQRVTGRVTESIAPTEPREIAALMLADYGWSSDQFSCLDQLYISESDWNPSATNPTSGAYGIPQSLPAEKMASAGADWRTNPATQIEWGLDYIAGSYGSPCSAWAFKQANNWY